MSSEHQGPRLSVKLDRMLGGLVNRGAGYLDSLTLNQHWTTGLSMTDLTGRVTREESSAA